MYETLYAEKPEELLSVNFVRRCRVVVEVIGETIAAITLASIELGCTLLVTATIGDASNLLSNTVITADFTENL